MDVTNNKNTEAEAEQVSNTGKSLGQTLAEARTNLKWSEQDIASKLNLSLVVVQNIEADQPSADLPMTFVRGYVRSYAMKVGLDGNMIHDLFDQQYGQQQLEVQTVKPISPYKIKRRELNANSGWFKILSILIIFALVGLGGWEAWKRFVKSGQQSADTHVNEISLADFDARNPVSETNDLKTDNGVNQEADENRAKPSITKSEPANTKSIDLASLSAEKSITTDKQASSNINSSAGVAVANKSPAELAEPISLVFDFSGDCWVEVVDATGETLATGVKHKDKHMPISGVPPISIKLGAPDNVRLQIEGEPFDLSNYAAGRTAKFTIGEQLNGTN